MTNSDQQKGVSLIEVMVALTVLMIAAGAIVNMQSNSLASAQASGIHFSLDYLSSEMIETLRANPGSAAAGFLDFDSASDTTAVTGTETGTLTSTNAEVIDWGERIAQQLPSGEGSISCTNELCDISISWLEELDGTYRRQIYNTRTRL